MNERERERVRVPDVRCPYCHDVVERGVEPAVCPECHALHHDECLAAHGACAACAAPHPRYEARAQRPREGAGAGKGEVVPPRGPSLRAVSLGFFALVGTIAAIASLADAGGDMALGLALSAAAFVAVLVNLRQSRLPMVFASFFASFGASFLVAAMAIEHIRRRHASEVVAAGVGLLVTGVAVWAWDRWTERREDPS